MHSLSKSAMGAAVVRPKRSLLLLLLFIALLLVGMPEALAHAVAEGDKGFIQESSGLLLLPFTYMGAKHMITGYDHLLFLFGVIFFLYRLKDVGIYVTLFAVGHSVTLLLGVLTEISISSYGLLASYCQFLASCLLRQRRHDERRFPVNGLPAHRSNRVSIRNSQHVQY